jgi:hypothetical protein
METNLKFDEDLYYYLIKAEIVENINLLLKEEISSLLDSLANNESISSTRLFGLLLGVPDDDVYETIEHIYQESYLGKDTTDKISSLFLSNEE